MNETPIDQWPGVAQPSSNSELWFASDNFTIQKQASNARESSQALSSAMASFFNYTRARPIAASRDDANFGWYLLGEKPRLIE